MCFYHLLLRVHGKIKHPCCFISEVRVREGEGAVVHVCIAHSLMDCRTSFIFLCDFSHFFGVKG